MRQSEREHKVLPQMRHACQAGAGRTRASHAPAAARAQTLANAIFHAFA